MRKIRSRFESAGEGASGVGNLWASSVRHMSRGSLVGRISTLGAHRALRGGFWALFSVALRVSTRSISHHVVSVAGSSPVGDAAGWTLWTDRTVVWESSLEGNYGRVSRSGVQSVRSVQRTLGGICPAFRGLSMPPSVSCAPLSRSSVSWERWRSDDAALSPSLHAVR
jgi:hypothetical protein